MHATGCVGGKVEVVPRVPIVCTGSDFSTLYAPLIEDGCMGETVGQG